MAKYVVPPRKKNSTTIVKCYYCGTMYVPEKREYNGYYEKCPTCHSSTNSNTNTIPLWKYNLIKYWRGLFSREQSDVSSTDN